MSSEELMIAYEYALNKAMDKWFEARPSIERSRDYERVYEGGFRMAWDDPDSFRSSERVLASTDIGE